MPEQPDRDGAQEPERSSPTPADSVHALAPLDYEREGEEPLPSAGPVALLIRRVAIVFVFPAFSLFYLSQALTIPLPDRTMLVSPRGFPTVLAAAMVFVTVLLAIFEIVKLARVHRASKEGRTFVERSDDDAEKITFWPDAWVTLGGLAAYIAVFTILGFFVATFLFLAGLSTYLAPKKWLRNVIVSAIFSLLVYLLFAQVLGVQLPAGLLTEIL